MRQSILVILLAVFVAGLTGCETVKGFGQDVENTGNNIQDIIGEAESEI